MAHLSGTISSAYSGRLQLILSGTFYQTSSRAAGFPGATDDTSEEGNILVRAYAGPTGSLQYIDPIDRYAPVSVAEFDYPGGSVVWDIGTEEISHVGPSASGDYWEYGIDNLRIIVVLKKK